MSSSTASSTAPTGCCSWSRASCPKSAWLADAETLTYLHSLHLDQAPPRARARDADASRRAPGRRAAHGRARAAARQRASAHAHHHRLPDCDLARDPRRAQSARLSLSLVHAGDLPRQDRRDEAARPHPPAVVRQAQVDHGDPQGGDDQRSLGAARHRRRTTRRLDADAALQELGSDAVAQAYVTATVTVWDDDPATADEKLRLVEKVIQGRDFTCIAETVNAVEAWLGSLPGHVYANVRQPPISTLNLAHMMPLSAVWAGPERDEHLGGTAALLCQDRRRDPVPLLSPCRRRRPYPGGRSDRRGQERAAGADGAAVPALSRMPRSSPSISAGRSGRPRSPWAAIGTTSAARSSR